MGLWHEADGTVSEKGLSFCSWYCHQVSHNLSGLRRVLFSNPQVTWYWGGTAAIMEYFRIHPSGWASVTFLAYTSSHVLSNVTLYPTEAKQLWEPNFFPPSFSLMSLFSIIVWQKIISRLLHRVPRSSSGKNQINEAHNLTLSSEGTLAL